MLPWGPIEWVLRKLRAESLPRQLIACVAFEDRCVAVPQIALAAGVRNIGVLCIKDPPSRYTPRITDKTARNRAQLDGLGLAADPFELELLASGQTTADALDRFLPLGEAQPVELWIDISCMPKRVFFLLIKLALQRPRVRTLIVTYTLSEPGQYPESHLAEDPDEVRPLPGFGPQTGEEPDTVVATVGFESLGLPQFLDEYRDLKRQIVFLLPFAPGQPYSRRTWASVMAIGGESEVGDIRRIVAVDAFGTYEAVCSVRHPSEARRRPLALAPYGPKPMSLGICLYALRTGSAVFYTQPRTYHPDYSTGIGESFAYCLRLNGRDTWDTADE